MFKNLRDRLKGVSKKLEDELEAEMEERLERELAQEMARDRGQDAGQDDETEPSAAPEEREIPSEPARGSEAVGDTLETPDGVEEAAEAPPDAREEPPEPAALDTRDEPAALDTRDEPAALDTRDEPAAPDEDLGDVPPEPPEEDQGSNEDAGPPADADVAEMEPPTPAPEENVEPAAPGAPGPGPTEKEQATERITGRKQLSAQEIEARLRSELEEAVEVQREVESVVRDSGAAVTRYTINEEVLDDILWELEVGLLESDVALPVIEAIKGNVREQLLSMSVAGRSADQVVEKVLRTAIRRVLNVGHFDFDAFVKERLEAGKKPIVVMFVGVNGTGKTTSIARIAHRLKENGVSSVMAAGDTFRAGAIEQLAAHGERLGVRVVKHSAGADPAAVAYDAIEHAKARRKDVVLLDTAGRMQTNTNLMDEMDKIRRVAKPDLVVFVGDSLAGNDAVDQARRFDEVVDIDGAILTKTDVDAKGGAALSVAYTINKPLLFVGVGQGYEDIRPFDADWMVDRLFGDPA